jgi:hypothetical protein
MAAVAMSDEQGGHESNEELREWLDGGRDEDG